MVFIGHDRLFTSILLTHHFEFAKASRGERQKLTVKDPNQKNRTIEIDECKTSIFSDGSIIIDTAGKNLLCIDFHDMLILLEKASRFRKLVHENA